MQQSSVEQFLSQSDVAPLIKPLDLTKRVRLTAGAYLFVYDRLVGAARINEVAAAMSCAVSMAYDWDSNSTCVHLIPLRPGSYPPATFAVARASVRAWSFDARHQKPNPFVGVKAYFDSASSPSLPVEECQSGTLTSRLAAVLRELAWLEDRFPNTG